VDELARELFASIDDDTSIRIGDQCGDIVLEHSGEKVAITCSAHGDTRSNAATGLAGWYRVGAPEILWSLEDVVAVLRAQHPRFFRRRTAVSSVQRDDSKAVFVLGHARSIGSTGAGTPLVMQRLALPPEETGLSERTAIAA
jgi:hypothetical protein